MLIENLRTKRTLLSLAVATALTLSVQANAADTLQGKVVADEAPNYSTQSGKQYWVLTGAEPTAPSSRRTKFRFRTFICPRLTRPLQTAIK